MNQQERSRLLGRHILSRHAVKIGKTRILPFIGAHYLVTPSRFICCYSNMGQHNAYTVNAGAYHNYVDAVYSHKGAHRGGNKEEPGQQACLNLWLDHR